ncbi:MAG: 5-(carboxyamino)imidazole ribonucleotide synthase [Verrucomicrobiota bacterium]
MNPGTDSWVGVLGGGQLGRMLALDARRMGFQVLKWTGGDRSGAAYTADLVFEEPFDSLDTLERFVDRIDVATVEFENVPASLLDKVAQRVPLMPAARAIGICQHREREKNFLATSGIPCAHFEVIDDPTALPEALARLPGDGILKTAEFGYDGKGQRHVQKNASPEDLQGIWNSLGAPRTVLEERVDLEAELSVMVVRGKDGAIVTYDPAENHHQNHILDLSIIPARLPHTLLAQAREIAITVAEALAYVGVLGVEFFVDKNHRILVNEMAPRPHNSGHHTINACATSQFEQQLRAITGMPLGSPRLIQPAVMWNLLGDLWLDEEVPPNWSPILATPGASLHLYGKKQARPGRKMGHATFVAATLEEALSNANRCRLAYGWDRDSNETQTTLAENASTH